MRKQIDEPSSLLRSIRSLLQLRSRENALRAGSLNLLAGLPEGILGYERRLRNEKVIVLMNFEEQETEVRLAAGECIFALTAGDRLTEGKVYLDRFGGVILK